MSDFFSEQFQGDVKQGISAFTGEPRPLKDPITESAEVEHSMNNNISNGSHEQANSTNRHYLTISRSRNSNSSPGPIPRKTVGAIRHMVLFNTVRTTLSYYRWLAAKMQRFHKSYRVST